MNDQNFKEALEEGKHVIELVTYDDKTFSSIVPPCFSPQLPRTAVFFSERCFELQRQQF
jgi:hypothetical protein